MVYFVIQVKTGSEDRFLRLVEDSDLGREIRFLWPRRRLRIRRRGRWENREAPIFPGYLFLETTEIKPSHYWALKRLPGFLRFLKDNLHIEPLRRPDQELLQHFLAFGEVVGGSLVRFEEDRRVRVISGPLKSLEGRIVKVDRRKGRARVKLDLYDDSFTIDFSFEVLGEAESRSH